MDIKGAYSEWSSTYDVDRNKTRDLDERVIREVLAHRRFDRTLEIGCGTGKNTAFLAGTGGKVIALDFSEGMIERARRKVSRDGVLFLVADITHPWPCGSASMDLVVCDLVLEHVRDISFVFGEASRVLANGGLFFVSELHPFRQYQGTKANFQRNDGTWEIEAFVHHLSDFTGAAQEHGLSLREFKEWWHKEDSDKPPRIASFVFVKPA